MSLATETQRVQQGVKDTLKTLIQKLGGTVGSEKVDGYPALASAISNKLLPDNLLSASTAALYGKPGTATPDEVFAMLYNAGNIEKVFESSAAGATTFDLPADTLMWWGVAVGGGGGGSSGEDDYYGGGGGAGGQVKVSGPYTPEAVKSNGVVIGAGGAGGAQAGTGQNSGSPGGTTSVFSLIAADGGPGGSTYTGGSGTGTSSGGNGKDRSPSVGSNGQSMPFGAATTFAAGGGGGGANITSSDPRRTGSLGGSADIGAGGKGGDGAPQSGVGGTGVNGSPGGGGGGGGGGGKSAGGAGGKGGDGYAAIFIIRKGGRA